MNCMSYQLQFTRDQYLLSHTELYTKETLKFTNYYCVIAVNQYVDKC